MSKWKIKGAESRLSRANKRKAAASRESNAVTGEAVKFAACVGGYIHREWEGEISGFVSALAALLFRVIRVAPEYRGYTI